MLEEIINLTALLISMCVVFLLFFYQNRVKWVHQLKPVLNTYWLDRKRAKRNHYRHLAWIYLESLDLQTFTASLERLLKWQYITKCGKL